VGEKKREKGKVGREGSSSSTGKREKKGGKRGFSFSKYHGKGGI